MRTKNLSLLLIILILFSFIGISGCIDIHWAKGFLEEEEYEIDYHIVQKWRLDHYFERDLGTHEEDMPIHILKGTTWLKINVSVVLNQSIGIARYLEITLLEPGEKSDKNMFLTRTYNATTTELIQVDDPIPGEWRFEIKGRGIGIGIGGFQDSYVVEVTTYEPYRKS